MSKPKFRSPVLGEVFEKYVDDEDTASFIKSVSERYTIGTLERLANHGLRISRRAAVLALGFLADYRSNGVLGRALRDEDRGVRLLAENAIRHVWCRDGNPAEQEKLRVVLRLNAARQYHKAFRLAQRLIGDAPTLAEAWNQRAIASFYLKRYVESSRDCHQALELNPYHFGAAVGLAQCHLQMNDAYSALDSFRRALGLNPNLEGVRAQIAYLRRSLEGT